MTPALLLTRAAADNQRLADKLAARGVRTWQMPLMQLVEEPEDAAARQMVLDLDRYQAIMVVSPAAARFGLQRVDSYWPQMPVGIDWFAVGESTARCLREADLVVQVPGQGQDSESLTALPAWQALLNQPSLRVLIWRGLGGREYLADQVRAAGGQVDYLELYRRQPATGLRESLNEALQQKPGGILLLSGQALEYWRQAAAEQWPEQCNWRCWVPSQRVAAQAEELGCTNIIVCNGADDDAVIEAVMAHPLT